MKIPSNNKWTQINDGDIFGTLNESYQLNFDKLGKLKGAKKPFAIYSSDSDANFKYAMSILYFDSAYQVVTSDAIFSFDLQAGAITQNTTYSPSTTLSSDSLIFRDSGGTDQMIVTIDDNFCRWNGVGTVSYTLGSLTSGVPHPLCIFESQVTYKLAIGNGNTVKLFDNAWSASSTVLTLPAQYVVTTLAYRNSYLYVGTKNIYGDEAKVFLWDGATANADYEVPIGGSWVFSLVPYNTTVAAIIDSGQLLQITGNQAVQIGALPVYYNPDAIWANSSGLTLNGKVFHRGMKVWKNRIYINVDGSTETGFVPEMKSGIWCYDPNIGLYHMASHTVDQFVADSSLSVTSSVITTSAVHNLKDGDTVQFSGVSGLTGVDIAVKYYVSVQSTTTIKLAKSRKALKESNFVSISGTAGGSDILVYIPNTDWSGGRNATSGAIGLLSPLGSPLDMWTSPIIWGARSDNKAGTAFYGLFGLTDSWNISRFSTQKIYTESISQAWDKITAFFDGLGISGESFILKKITGSKYGYPTQILKGVWLNTNTINSDSLTLDEDEWHDIDEGDEVVIVDGYGRGYSAHVESIETSSTVVSITLDESIGTTNGAVYLYVTNAKKIRSITNTRELNERSSDSLQDKSSWIQIKGELRGFTPELSSIQIDNNKER